MKKHIVKLEKPELCGSLEATYEETLGELSVGYILNEKELVKFISEQCGFPHCSSYISYIIDNIRADAIVTELLSFFGEYGLKEEDIRRFMRPFNGNK